MSDQEMKMARGDYPSDKQDQYMVRFPEGMRDWIKDAAAKNNRSMNAEIIARLRQSFEEGFSDDQLLASIKELILAKRISDLFGAEVLEGIGLYAQHVSQADQWTDALEELLRWALIDAGLLTADEGEVRPASTFAGASEKWDANKRPRPDDWSDDNGYVIDHLHRSGKKDD